MRQIRDVFLPQVAPSVLACNRHNAILEAAETKDYGVKILHFDMMDGKFVPQKTSFHPGFVMSHHFDGFIKDVHLMVINPINRVDAYLEAGADVITFHLEAYKTKKAVMRTIEKIKAGGALAGLSIKPDTPVSALLPFMGMVDLILLMSVEPGMGGQKFMPESVQRAKDIRSLIRKEGRDIILEIDGGINAVTSKLVSSYVDIFVSGSYLFGHSDFKSRMLALIENQ
ncbi:MAG: ribulose-phosphate 3-epimerase [Bacilli bacterium]|nr:ribulose-phosphate 3-epimerase [Bacilli bacterium]